MKQWLLVFGCFLAVTQAARADVTLNGLFTDGAVLQRSIKMPVFGTAANGEKVTVRFRGQTVQTVAQNGAWRVDLKPQKAGGPDALSVTGTNTVTLPSVYVGEVYICSGQSNMEFGIGNITDAASIIAQANDPLLHLYTVQKKVATQPEISPQGEWLVCTPENVKVGGWNGFSAVAYYFGRSLTRALHVPVGLIHTSWGGTPAQAWTSREALAANPILAHYVAAPPDKIDQYSPTTLYNGMIAPLIPYAIRGAIWYQGESNAGQAYEYRTLFPAMIRDWRTRWGEGDFPFFFVQLAPFGADSRYPNWPELREAQLLTAQTVPHTGEAVITDVGDEKDIHPKRKQPVGERLALLARAQVYGEKVEWSGPQYDKVKFDGAHALVHFTHTDGQLKTADGGALTGWTIAGADGKFVDAQAALDGDTVKVSSPDVPHPVAVRYGWSNFPVVNLVNKAGLPASPFRTDTFPLLTQPK